MKLKPKEAMHEVFFDSVNWLPKGWALVAELSSAKTKSKHSLQVSESLFWDTQLPATLPPSKAQLQKECAWPP